MPHPYTEIGKVVFHSITGQSNGCWHFRAVSMKDGKPVQLYIKFSPKDASKYLASNYLKEGFQKKHYKQVEHIRPPEQAIQRLETLVRACLIDNGPEFSDELPSKQYHRFRWTHPDLTMGVISVNDAPFGV